MSPDEKERNRKFSKKMGKEIIHSGHFMVSEIDEEDDTAVSLIGVHGSVDDNSDKNPMSLVPRIVSARVRGYDFNYACKETFKNYHFAPRSSHSISIDASLTKLFECMTLAYCGQLTSPRWKTFKGLKFRLKEKIRLNNIIWRAWHIQYILKCKPAICQFASPLEGDVHSTPEAVVMEGKYWKRNLTSVKAEYMKWRLFFKQMGKHRTDHGRVTLSLEVEDDSSRDDGLGCFTLDDDILMEFSDTLFSCLHHNQPFDLPNPREIAGKVGNADFIQPGLVQLQPSFDDSMDTFDPIEDILMNRFPTAQQDSSLQNTAYTSAKNQVPSVTEPLHVQGFSTVSNIPFNDFPSSKLQHQDPIAPQLEFFEDSFIQDNESCSRHELLSSSCQNHQTSVAVSSPSFDIANSTAARTGTDLSLMLGSTEGSNLETHLQTQFSNLSPSVESFNISQQHISTPSQPTVGLFSSDYSCHHTVTQSVPMLELPPSTYSSVCTMPVFSLPSIEKNHQTLTLPVLQSPSEKWTVLTEDFNSHSQSVSTGVLDKLYSDVCSPEEMQVIRTTIVSKDHVQPRRHSFAGTWQPQQKRTDFCGTKSLEKITQKTPFAVPKPPSNARVLSKFRPLTPVTISNPARTEQKISTNNIEVLIPGTFSSTCCAVPQNLLASSTFITTKANPDHLLRKSSAKLGCGGSISTEAIPNTGSSSACLTKLLSSGISKFLVGSQIQPQKVMNVTTVSTVPTIAVITTGCGSTTATRQAYILPSVPLSAVTSVSDFQRNLLVGAASQALIGQPVTSKLPQSSIHVSNSKEFTRTTSQANSVETGVQITDRKATYKEHRRVSHINAEQKRRCNIKYGFDALRQLIPSLSQNSHTKFTKAVMLQKGAEYIQYLKSQKQQQREEIQALQQEIKGLNEDICLFQQQLPATGAPVMHSQSTKLKELFEEYVRQKTLQNWKFWIFSLIMERLLETYNNVSTSNVDEFCRTILAWLDQHCSLSTLRPGVLSSLCHLSTSTNILSDPSKMPDEATRAVTKNESQFYS